MKYLALALVWLAMLASCANQVAPTGGEKDTTPPSIVKTVPNNETVNFNYPSIYLEFDEFIQFQYPNPSFSITPALPAEPEVTIKNKSISIQLPDSLLRNTTYLINFGNSIKDLNENNELPNYTYVFSTGAYIDSLEMKIEVVNATSEEPVKDVLVGLYPTTWDDSTLINTKPVYYTKSNEEGLAQFSYLGQDTFQVIAFGDKNNDNVFQPASESVGFSSTHLSTAKDASVEMLKFNDPSDYDFTVSTQQKGAGHLQMQFSRSLDDENIQLLDVDTFFIRTESPDSFQVYYLPDTLSRLILFTTSPDQDTLLDTITLRSFPPQDSMFVLSAPAYSIIKDSLYLHFTSPYPIRLTDTSGIKIQVDSAVYPYSLLQEYPLTISIHPIPFGDTLSIQIGKKSLINWLSRYNKYLSNNILIPRKASYGQLVIEVDSSWYDQKGHFYIQLISNQGVILQTCRNCTTWRLPFVAPGEYNVRILQDENANGFWDKGRWATRQQPESYYYYPETITIRSNWENNITIRKE